MNDRELPERLDRKVIYESDYVCLYADKVKLSKGGGCTSRMHGRNRVYR